MATSAMNNRRWYPVSRAAPEQIKASKHSMDPSMTAPLPGVQTTIDQALASHHIAGWGSSIPGRSRRADRPMTTPLREKMQQDLQLAGLVEGTQEVYLRAVRQLAAHFHQPPDRLTEQQVRDYLLHLKNE